MNPQLVAVYKTRQSLAYTPIRSIVGDNLTSGLNKLIEEEEKKNLLCCTGRLLKTMFEMHIFFSSWEKMSQWPRSAVASLRCPQTAPGASSCKDPPLQQAVMWIKTNVKRLPLCGKGKIVQLTKKKPTPKNPTWHLSNYSWKWSSAAVPRLHLSSSPEQLFFSVMSTTNHQYSYCA